MKYYTAKIHCILTSAAVCLLTAACAQSYTEDTYSIYEKVLGAWVRVNYPECEDNRTDSGGYILEYDEGGGEMVCEEGYVFVHYIKTTLDGSVSATNREDITTRLGNYSHSDYYGSDIWRLGHGYLPAGIEEVLSGVRVGTRIKIALPVAASEVDSVKYTAFSSATSSDNVIYELEVDDCVEDIEAYEIAELEKFRDNTYPGTDSLVKGFYIKKLYEYVPDESDTDTIEDGTELEIRYIGKLLNGQVFDTNIEDTARKYRIYDSDNDYEALTVEYYQDLDDFIENNSVVEGFSRAVVNMKPGDIAETFFMSDYGYGDAGSSTTIPEYAPLRFYLYFEEDDE